MRAAQDALRHASGNRVLSLCNLLGHYVLERPPIRICVCAPVVERIWMPGEERVVCQTPTMRVEGRHELLKWKYDLLRAIFLVIVAGTS